MFGAGKYDLVCEHVRKVTSAEGVLVIVINGDQGQGFSCQLTPALLPMVPALLRHVADQIEADAKQHAALAKTTKGN